MKNIIEDVKYNEGEICLIGDAVNDYNAASINKVLFYGYNNDELKKIKEALYIKSFYNLNIDEL